MNLNSKDNQTDKNARQGKDKTNPVEYSPETKKFSDKKKSKKEKKKKWKKK